MSREQEVKTHQPRRRGPMGHGMQPGEKPKDFKKSIKKLMSYIGKYKAAIFVVMFFAACSTIFNVAGPKILGKATTALSEGLMAKIQGTGSIDFGKIGSILLFVLGLYLCSAVFNFIQGWIMTGITQKVCYQLRKEISEKINRMPMKYFESRTYGEVLSRITNDVDTLGQGLNQSITTIITSVATLIGVLDDDAQYFTAYDTYCTCDLTNLHGTDWICDKKIAEIFPCAAGVFRTHQWTGGRGIRRSPCHQGI